MKSGLARARCLFLVVVVNIKLTYEFSRVEFSFRDDVRARRLLFRAYSMYFTHSSDFALNRYIVELGSTDYFVL